MRQILFIFLCYFSLQVYAQEPLLAYQYFRNGEYEKSASMYKVLHKKNPFNTTYINLLIDCHQQLENYDEIKNIVNHQLKNYPNQEYLYVELGYSYQLQHQTESATTFYEKALNSITKKSNIGYLTGKSFQDNHLLEYALKAYRKTMNLNPNSNFNYQIARIYGEMGEVENMFNTYLDMVSISDNYLQTAKSYIGKFISEDPQSNYNLILKRQLIKRLQNNPQNSWNDFLSWLFMQQHDYNKALVQEKALHKRNLNSLKGILEVGKIAFENKDFETSKKSFQYSLENADNLKNELISKLYLLEIGIKTDIDHAIIESQFQDFFEQYGENKETINIQIIYADFLAFKKHEFTKAIEVLKRGLILPINQFQKGHLKTKLADILLFNNKFSSALIYYTQVQNDLKNQTIGQTARFKIAQTSYFKGDFDWAQSQLKVLKNSTSQLIANDALDLNLLITDNSVKDSLKIALKKYATADFLSLQNKNKEAIDTLYFVLNNFKGHPIEDEVLFKQAKLFEKNEEYKKAEFNYLKLIQLNSEDILVDDAHYYLAELYLNKIKNKEKAMTYYQKIIFDYPSSIYLVDARKKFRKLRGDQIN